MRTVSRDRVDGSKAAAWILIIVLIGWCWFWLARLIEWMAE